MILAFLLSPPRSGSTLLSALLDLHPEIRVSSEPWMLLSLRAMYKETAQGALYGAESLNRGFTEFLTEKEFEGAARRFAESVYADKLRETGKRIFVDKSPRYYHILNFVQELFPEAKFIVLSRNPLDIATSISASWGVSPEELTGKYISPFTFDLDFAIRRLNRFKAANSNVIHIRYEDLVENPEDALRTVQEFLGVMMPEVDLEYRKSRLYGESRAHAMGDKKIISHVRPHQGSVSGWKVWLDSATVNALAQLFTMQELSDFGYPDLVAELRSQDVTFRSEEDALDRDKKLEAVAKDFNNYVGLDIAAVGAVPETENEAFDTSPEPIDRFTKRINVKVLHQQLTRKELSACVKQSLAQLAIYSGERNYLRDRVRELEFANGSAFAFLIICLDHLLAIHEKFVGDTGELRAKRDTTIFKTGCEKERLRHLGAVGEEIFSRLNSNLKRFVEDLEQCREDLEQCREDLEQCREDLEQCRKDLEQVRKELETAKSLNGVYNFLASEMPKRLGARVIRRFRKESR